MVLVKVSGMNNTYINKQFRLFLENQCSTFALSRVELLVQITELGRPHLVIRRLILFFILTLFQEGFEVTFSHFLLQ